MAEPTGDVMLPGADDRAWLLERLADLVQRFGAARLLVGPLPDRDPAWFPDPWTGGTAGVRRLLRRLMLYAGMPEARIEVAIDDDVGGGAGGSAIGSTFAAVWFSSKRDKTLHFHVLASALAEPQVVVPAAARAVAEAFLRVAGVIVGDDRQGQGLVDVCAVYLGFGVLTTDAAIRTIVGAQATLRRTRAQRSRLGVLGPQAMAFLLAAATLARQTDERGVKAIAKQLQANPAAFFKAARAWLVRHDPPLPTLLKLPERSTWPEPPDLDALREPIDDDDDERDDAPPDAAAPEDRGVLGMNAGKPVFRVERSKALRLGKMLALPVILLAMLAGRMNLGIDLPMWQAAVAAAVLGVLGLAVGRLIPDARCSEPKCGQPLPRDATVCSRCGGTIRGVIAHPRERLAAEEALTASEPATAQAPAASNEAPPSSSGAT